MKTKLKFIFGIMAIILTALLTLSGCFSSPERLIEDTIQSLIEAENESIEASSEAMESSSDNNTDSQESTGTQIEYSDTIKWPDELPGYVPPLEGDIVGHVKVFPEEGFTSHVISFENAGGNDMNAYVDLLLANGWSIDMQNVMSDAWIVQAHRGDSEFINAGVELEESSGMINVILPD